MVRRVLSLCLFGAFAGCVAQDPGTRLVPSTPFGSAPVVQRPSTSSYAQASSDTAVRVATGGRKLLEANPQIGLRPVFRTPGAPQTEIFHRGTNDVFVTPSPGKQCR